MSEIAGAFAQWFMKWGATTDTLGRQAIQLFLATGRMQVDDLARFRLTTWHQHALRELKELLKRVGVDADAVPGNLVASRELAKKANAKVPPFLMNEVFGFLHDLATFGPTRTFRPDQAFENALRLIRIFSR